MPTIQIPTGRTPTPRIGNPLRAFTGKLPWIIGALVVLAVLPSMFV